LTKLKIPKNRIRHLKFEVC